MITKEWLESRRACAKGIKWFVNQDEKDPVKLIHWAIRNENHLNWANWLIVRIMDNKQYVRYAVYAAEQVLHIYEEKYPEDSSVREAIDAAKKCITDPNEKNKTAYAAVNAAAAYAENKTIIKILNYGLNIVNANEMV